MWKESESTIATSQLIDALHLWHQMMLSKLFIILERLVSSDVDSLMRRNGCGRIRKICSSVCYTNEWTV